MPPPTSKVASQALFQQTLSDVLRKLRSVSTSAGEEEIISKMMDDIKSEISSSLATVKVIAIQKAMYFSMLGYNPDFSFFPIVEIMADKSFGNKRVAYMAASLNFTEDADVIPLTTGLLLRDLQSPNAYEQGLALSFLSSVCTPELARDVVSHVVDLLENRYPAHIRKKAVICLYKLFLEYPDALRPVYLKLKDKVDDSSPEKDTDSGVRGAVVCVLCELARRLPVTYLGLAIPFFSLLSSIEGNWALIKIVKVFGYFVPHEPRLVKKLAGPLEKLIESTKATSVKYECYLTIMSTGLSTIPTLAALAVNGIKGFLEEMDQNLRFMGLEAASRLAATAPKVLAPIRKVVLRCIEDEDPTIRKKAALILRDITPEKHLVATVMHMIAHSVCTPPDPKWTNEVVKRIIQLVRREDYSNLTDFEWYVSVLLDLYRLPVEPFDHGFLVHQELVTMLLRVSSVRSFAVHALAQTFLDPGSPLPPPPPAPGSGASSGAEGRHSSSIGHTGWYVLCAAAFACGEYPTALTADSRIALCSAFLSGSMRLYPAELQCTCLWATAKLIASLRRHPSSNHRSRRNSLDYQDEEANNAISTWLRDRGRFLLESFIYSPHPRVTETAMLVQHLILDDKDGTVSDGFFASEFLPVGVGAQEECQAPIDVDLETLLCPNLLELLPLSESEDEDGFKDDIEEAEEDDDGIDLSPVYIPGLAMPTSSRRAAQERQQERVAAYYLEEEGGNEAEMKATPGHRMMKRAAGVNLSLAHSVNPGRLTHQLMAQRRQQPARVMAHKAKELMRPVAAGLHSPQGNAEDEEDDTNVDEITRRLRHVDVSQAITAEDALPNTSLSYAALLDMAAKKKMDEQKKMREQVYPPISLLETNWLNVRLRCEGGREGGVAKVRREDGVLLLRYLVEVEHVITTGLGTGHYLSDVRIRLNLPDRSQTTNEGGDLAGEDNRGWSGLKLLAAESPRSSPAVVCEDGEVYVCGKLKEGGTATLAVLFEVTELPSLLQETPIPLQLHCVRNRKEQFLSMNFVVPPSHFVKNRRSSSHSSSILSSEEFHRILASLPADEAAMEEVLTAVVPCRPNDLLIAIPQLQTDLGLTAVDVFPHAMALYADILVPYEAINADVDTINDDPVDSVKESAKHRSQRRAEKKNRPRLFVFLREQVSTDVEENDEADGIPPAPSDEKVRKQKNRGNKTRSKKHQPNYNVIVSVRCTVPSIGEHMILSIVDTLQNAL